LWQEKAKYNHDAKRPKSMKGQFGTQSSVEDASKRRCHYEAWDMTQKNNPYVEVASDAVVTYSHKVGVEP
jgi:hypothetical protein